MEIVAFSTKELSIYKLCAIATGLALALKKFIPAHADISPLKLTFCKLSQPLNASAPILEIVFANVISSIVAQLLNAFASMDQPLVTATLTKLFFGMDDIAKVGIVA